MSFGNNLKKIRQDNQLTQEELAKKINTSRSNIANYENDKNMPSFEILEKLSKELNCSTDYLMGLTSHTNPKEELEKALYSYNLTEEEYCDAINCFMNDNIIGLGFMIFYGGFEETREHKIIKTILHFILDYIPDKNMLNDLGEQEFFEKKLEQNLQLSKKLLLSLDKSKIIHDETKKINDTILKIGLDMKEYNPPTEAQKKQIEEFAKFVLKDNKKE